MRLEVGPYAVTATNGRTIHVDQPISVRQADLVVELLDRAFLSEDVTWAIEMHEGEIAIEYYVVGDDGKIQVGTEGVLTRRMVLR